MSTGPHGLAHRIARPSPLMVCSPPTQAQVTDAVERSLKRHHVPINEKTRADGIKYIQSLIATGRNLNIGCNRFDLGSYKAKLGATVAQTKTHIRKTGGEHHPKGVVTKHPHAPKGTAPAARFAPRGHAAWTGAATANSGAHPKGAHRGKHGHRGKHAAAGTQRPPQAPAPGQPPVRKPLNAVWR